MTINTTRREIYGLDSISHVDLTVLPIFQKTVTFDHNMTPFT